MYKQHLQAPCLLGLSVNVKDEADVDGEHGLQYFDIQEVLKI